MRKLTLIAAVVILVFSVSPASASSPPLDVQFELDSTWYNPPEGPITGTFIATGAAVNAELMCPAGWTINVGGFSTPPDSKGNYTFHILKGFVCDGADPEFDWFILRIEGRSFNNITGVYSWSVWKASGMFDKLHGTGNGEVEYDGPYHFLDTMAGQAHID